MYFNGAFHCNFTVKSTDNLFACEIQLIYGDFLRVKLILFETMNELLYFSYLIDILIAFILYYQKVLFFSFR